MKKLLSLVKGKYLIMTLITPLLMIGEVIMETVIPRIMADLIDNGIGHMDIKYVIRGGFLMLLMSLISMLFGAGAAYTSSVASMGFGSEVRKKLFNKVQDFSFSNVDKFSTSSLITRLTTDITNLQIKL
jgi:ATP-binding cassette subfamily B protein